MHFGRGNKLQDEINPTGHKYSFKEDLEMLFWVAIIYLIVGWFVFLKI